MTPDIIRHFDEVVQGAAAELNTDLFFYYGNEVAVSSDLTIKANAISEATRRRYPLVWLVMPFEEEKKGGLHTVTAQLVIATSTDMNYSTEQRMGKVFKPVLYPIYEALLQQISRSKAFGMPAVRHINHTKIDFPYWGAGQKNFFNDFIDAIQVKNLKVPIKQHC